MRDMRSEREGKPLRCRSLRVFNPRDNLLLVSRPGARGLISINPRNKFARARERASERKVEAGRGKGKEGDESITDPHAEDLVSREHLSSVVVATREIGTGRSNEYSAERNESRAVALLIKRPIKTAHRMGDVALSRIEKRQSRLAFSSLPFIPFPFF